MVTLWLLSVLFAGGGTAPPNERQAPFESLDVLDWIGKPVSGARWEPVARVETLLFDPQKGRATFVVLSFVGREGLLAVPWGEITVDSQGRARLAAPERALQRAIAYHGGGSSIEERERASEPALSPIGPRGDDAARVPPLRMDRGAETLLRGTIVGLVRSGEGRLVALVDAGTDTVSVDLGSGIARDESLAKLAPGDAVEIVGRRDSAGELSAAEIRWRGVSRRIGDEQ